MARRTPSVNQPFWPYVPNLSGVKPTGELKSGPFQHDPRSEILPDHFRLDNGVTSCGQRGAKDLDRLGCVTLPPKIRPNEEAYPPVVKPDSPDQAGRCGTPYRVEVINIEAGQAMRKERGRYGRVFRHILQPSPGTVVSPGQTAPHSGDDWRQSVHGAARSSGLTLRPEPLEQLRQSFPGTPFAFAEGCKRGPLFHGHRVDFGLRLSVTRRDALDQPGTN